MYVHIKYNLGLPSAVYVWAGDFVIPGIMALRPIPSLWIHAEKEMGESLHYCCYYSRGMEHKKINAVSRRRGEDQLGLSRHFVTFLKVMHKIRKIRCVFINDK